MKKSYLCLFLALAIATPTWAVVNGTKVIKKSVGLGGPEDYVVELNIEKRILPQVEATRSPAIVQAFLLLRLSS